MTVAFVFTNPRHHFEMMAPVARELAARGERVQMISLAELRGLRTPESAADLPVVRALPVLRKSPSTGAGLGHSAAGSSPLRRAVQAGVWHALLAPRMWQLLRGADVVVIPNDSVWPYIELLQAVRARGGRVALMQEGIRFDLPSIFQGERYAAGGADAVCAWGEGSAEHFRAAARPGTVRVTGNPRFDAIEPDAWRARGETLLARLGLSRAPLAYLSNPIENQGFCSRAEKLALFERFVRGAGPVLVARDVPLLLKTHLHEDPEELARIARRAGFAGALHVVPASEPLFGVLACARAAVVLASTVGLEALMFGVPLGVLEIPGHGFAFEYVARGAAVGVTGEAPAAGVAELLDRSETRAEPARALVERHLYARGQSAGHVADTIRQLRRAP